MKTSQFNSKWKLIIAGMMGNTLEFYDFALYSFFAPVIAPLFFPSLDPLTALLSSLGTYAVGFVMRPVGGILFGALGDYYGRKFSLMVCISIMAIATCLIGLTPTYQKIGIYAPIILIFCRLLQGLSAGGEYNGAVIFVLEHYSRQNRGFAAGIIYSSSYIGFLLAAFVGAFFSMLQLEWAWRIPFILGLIIGIIGYYLRAHIEESPEFHQYKTLHPKVGCGLLDVLKKYKVSFLKAFSASALTGILSITTLTYINTHLIVFMHWPKSKSMIIVAISSFLSALISPLYGFYADKFKKEYLMAIGAILAAITAYPMFNSLNSDNFWIVVLWQIIWVASTMMFMSPMNLFITEQFPVSARYSGVAASYSLALALFGGTTPIIMIYLNSHLKYQGFSVSWIIFGCLIGLFSISSNIKSTKIDLVEQDDLIKTG